VAGDEVEMMIDERSINTHAKSPTVSAEIEIGITYAPEQFRDKVCSISVPGYTDGWRTKI